MNFIQQRAVQAIKDRGAKVPSFDKDVSHTPFIIAIDRAQRKLSRMSRYGSRRVKVAVRRNGSVSPVDAVSTVRAALQRRV
ncbi:hypothetical protein [Paraburkholderia tropica]|uniref:hypothetical protein n=1 Tax=Paraburkholderia tropica TaxID=92647 RepID=UPI003D265B06